MVRMDHGESMRQRQTEPTNNQHLQTHTCFALVHQVQPIQETAPTEYRTIDLKQVLTLEPWILIKHGILMRTSKRSDLIKIHYKTYTTLCFILLHVHSSELQLHNSYLVGFKCCHKLSIRKITSPTQDLQSIKFAVIQAIMNEINCINSKLTWPNE